MTRKREAVLYILYAYPDEDAPVLAVAETLREARADRRDCGGVIYEYDMGAGGVARNGRLVT